jgi:hypothetical protein
MDAILFSANPSMVIVDDAIQHLASYAQLYWEVGFSIKYETLVFPMLGYIHVCGQQVQYKVMIQNIIPFSRRHYEDPVFSRTVKPEPWIREWIENIGNTRAHSWRNALVLTMIEPFIALPEFRKLDGSPVIRAPQTTSGCCLGERQVHYHHQHRPRRHPGRSERRSLSVRPNPILEQTWRIL